MDKRILLGVDVGGTKCAVTLGVSIDGDIEIKDKICFPTVGVDDTIERIKTEIHNILKGNSLKNSEVYSIGVSCGGPLDSATGVIMSPPNLPGWDNIPIVRILSEEFECPHRTQRRKCLCTGRVEVRSRQGGREYGLSDIRDRSGSRADT